MYRFPYRRVPQAEPPVPATAIPVETPAVLAPAVPAPAPAVPAPAVPAPAPVVAPPPIQDSRPAATVAMTRQKRLTTEYRRACTDPELKDNLKLLPKDLGVWYFMIKSDEGCESIFEVKHAYNYPFGPPVITCLTNNGVFKPGVTLCTSFTHYHPDQWDPSMTTEKIFIGMTAYFNLVVEGKDRGVGVDLVPADNRKRLAQLSADYNKTNLKKEVVDLFYYEGSPWGGCTPLVFPGKKV